MTYYAELRRRETEALEARHERRERIRFDYPIPVSDAMDWVQCVVCGSAFGRESDDGCCAYCKGDREWQLCDGSGYPACKNDHECWCLGFTHCDKCGTPVMADEQRPWGCRACWGSAA